MWYYNAGEAPTQVILSKNPTLVHRVKELFGVQGLAKELYEDSKFEWKKFFAIHLLARHRNYHVFLLVGCRGFVLSLCWASPNGTGLWGHI